MKENAIEKINKMGKIGGIIVTVMKVFVIIGLVATIIAGIVFAVLPKDFAQLQVSGTALVDLNWSTLKWKARQSDIDQVEASIGNSENNSSQSENTQSDDTQNNGSSVKVTGSMNLNGMDYSVDDVDMTEDGMTINASADHLTVSLHSLAWVMLMAALRLAMTLVTLFFIGFLCKAIKNCSSPFDAGVIQKMQNFAISLIPWVILSSFSNSVIQSIFSGKVNIVTTFDLTVVMIIVLVLALVYIFKYGAVLQQESDETL